jgi:PAS domain S-box-containing protein
MSGGWLSDERGLDALHESEVRFRRLAALSADVYWEQDEELRFISFTTSRSSHIERRYTEKLIGRTRWQVDYVNMSQADWVAHRAVLEARAPFRDLELCRYDTIGRKIWVRVSGEPMFDASGRFKGYQGIACDITERRRAEELRGLEHAVTRIIADADSASAALQSRSGPCARPRAGTAGACSAWTSRRRCFASPRVGASTIPPCSASSRSRAGWSTSPAPA